MKRCNSANHVRSIGPPCAKLRLVAILHARRAIATTRGLVEGGRVDRCARPENITTRNTRRKPRRVSLRVSSRFRASEDIFRVSQPEADVKVAGCKDPPRKIVHQDRVYNRGSGRVSNFPTGLRGREEDEDKNSPSSIYIYIYTVNRHLLSR